MSTSEVFAQTSGLERPAEVSCKDSASRVLAAQVLFVLGAVPLLPRGTSQEPEELRSVVKPITAHPETTGSDTGAFPRGAA